MRPPLAQSYVPGWPVIREDQALCGAGRPNRFRSRKWQHRPVHDTGPNLVRERQHPTLNRRSSPSPSGIQCHPLARPGAPRYGTDPARCHRLSWERGVGIVDPYGCGPSVSGLRCAASPRDERRPSINAPATTPSSPTTAEISPKIVKAKRKARTISSTPSPISTLATGRSLRGVHRP